MKLQLLLFRHQTYEAEHEAPVTSTFVSLIFVAGMAVIIALYSGETLRCSVQQNQVGCQIMSSAGDCDNLLLVSCTTKCGGTPYSYCNDFIITMVEQAQAAQCSWTATSNTGGHYQLSGTSTPLPNPGDKLWQGLTPPTNSLTCKIFYSKYATASTPGTSLEAYFEYLWPCASYVKSIPTRAASCPLTIPPPDFWPSYCPSWVNSGQTCCTEPKSMVGESLSECCGTLKSMKVCLSASSTIGVIGGYLSLWYSILQAAYALFAQAYMYRQKMTENDGAETAELEWSVKNGEVELVKEDSKMIPVAAPDANTV